MHSEESILLHVAEGGYLGGQVSEQEMAGERSTDGGRGAAEGETADNLFSTASLILAAMSAQRG